MISLRLAHLSDIHFGKICMNLTQFLSKRWIGNLNFFLFRKRQYQSSHLCYLPELFEKLQVERICFTGDFTTTSQEEEFALAQKFLNLFPQPFFLLPGNHDAYTKEAAKKKVFYHYFPSLQEECGFSLKEDRIVCKKIKQGWYWIGLDCAFSTPVFQAYGIFTPEMAEKLRFVLNHIPQDENIIIGNHFPLFSSHSKQHDLKNADLLRKIVKEQFPRIKLYLHGHIHKPKLINKIHDGYPLVVNSGCSAFVENGGFYLIDLQKSECLITHYFYQESKGWFPEKKTQYLFY